MTIGDIMLESVKFVDEVIKFIAEKFNSNNINYYIVGAIGGYIDAKVPLKRNHDDLDIMIEEKDIEKVKEIFNNTEYVFYDNRYDNNKVLNDNGYTDGDHEVYAQYKNDSFHIGFFLFRIDNDKYTIIEYFKDGNKCKRLERSLPIEIFEYQYNDEGVYNGVPVKVARKELIYKNKKVMNRDKDIFDVKSLEKSIDWTLFDKLKGLSKVRVTKISDV
jgi:hypothetical protein